VVRLLEGARSVLKDSAPSCDYHRQSMGDLQIDRLDEEFSGRYSVILCQRRSESWSEAHSAPASVSARFGSIYPLCPHEAWPRRRNSKGGMRKAFCRTLLNGVVMDRPPRRIIPDRPITTDHHLRFSGSRHPSPHAAQLARS